MNNLFFLSIVAAFCFSTWPLVTRSCGLSAAWITIVVSGGTLFVGLLMLSQTPVQPSKTVFIGLLAGLINGIGMWAYSKLLNQSHEMSKVIPLTAALIPFFGALGGILLFGESTGFKKISGIVAIIIGMLLLA